MPQCHSSLAQLLLISSTWLAFITPLTQSKNLVFIPNPATSHTRYHTRVARAVSSMGHKVWLTMPTYLSEKGYLDTSGFDIIPYESPPRIEERIMELFTGRYFRGETQNFFAFLEMSKEIYRALLANDTFIDVIRQKKPDLIVIDNVPTLYPLAVIAYKLHTPFAFFGTAYDPVTARVPFSPAESPSVIHPYSNSMSFRQRLETFLLYFVTVLHNPIYSTNPVTEYAPEMPYIAFDMLIAQAEIWLVELDHILDYPRPTLPNVKLIGGTATGPAKPLPAHFRTFMDDATQGVVIVSFGSYVLSVPTDISDKLFNVFQRLPMKVVFRSNLTSPDPSKIMTSRWLPQNDLLGHANTKVFVSHCGKNGQYEALYHAVPIVAVPLFADQPYNAERARLKGFAEVVDLLTSTEKELTDAILKVAGEPRYKQAITKLSFLLKKFNGVPAEKAAFWLDHVMEYGGGYMRSAGQQMPYYQFLMIDVILFLLAVFFVLGIVLCFCVCSLCRCLFKKKLKSE